MLGQFLRKISNLQTKSPLYKTKSCCAGISLVEILIGITILGFTTAPLFLLFLQGSGISKNESNRVQALYIAQKILSEIKAGVARTPDFTYNVQTNMPFKLTKEPDFTFSSFKGASFLQLIAGQNPPISRGNPYHKQLEKYEVNVDSETIARGQIKYTVTVKWPRKKQEGSVELAGLVDTLPNKFRQNY